MSWKKGPLPKDTWFWGGVVPKGENTAGGFYFADFCGDHVLIYNDFKMEEKRRIEPEDVLFYNNCLTLPIMVDKDA